MQHNLTVFASVLAMIHMALGCYWHHGLARAHSCQNQTTAVSHADDGCSHHHALDTVHHLAGQLNDGRLACDAACQESELHCFDDRCKYLPAVEFEFENFGSHHFTYVSMSAGGQASQHLIRFAAEEPCWRQSAPPVRAHLLHGVLII